MNVTAIDTHAVVKRLLAARFTDAQAEAVTLVVRDAQDIDLSNLTTKADLAGTKAGLGKVTAGVKAYLETLKADLEKTMAEVKVEIL